MLTIEHDDCTAVQGQEPDLLRNLIIGGRDVPREVGQRLHLLGIACFHGEPRTGKTLAAYQVAHALHRSVIRVDLTALASKTLGAIEKHIAAAFYAAEQVNGILLFDDAAPLPYPPRWKVFPATPLHCTLSADPWNIPETDIRKTWCWDAALNGAPVAGCEFEVKNLA